MIAVLHAGDYSDDIRPGGFGSRLLRICGYGSTDELCDHTNRVVDAS